MTLVMIEPSYILSMISPDFMSRHLNCLTVRGLIRAVLQNELNGSFNHCLVGDGGALCLRELTWLRRCFDRIHEQMWESLLVANV